MRLFRIPVAIALALALTVGASPMPAPAAAPPAYFVDESKLPFDQLAGTNTHRLWGMHNGAGYRIEVPDNWNGELVLYAHGDPSPCPSAIVRTLPCMAIARRPSSSLTATTLAASNDSVLSRSQARSSSRNMRLAAPVCGR